MLLSVRRFPHCGSINSVAVVDAAHNLEMAAICIVDLVPAFDRPVSPAFTFFHLFPGSMRVCKCGCWGFSRPMASFLGSSPVLTGVLGRLFLTGYCVLALAV